MSKTPSFKSTPRKTPSFKILRNPTFLLKGVDPVAIWNSYIEGKYANTKVVVDPNLNINPIQLTLPEGSSPADEIYTIKDKNGIPTMALSTNHSLTRNGGRVSEIPIEGECDGCRKVLEDPPIGIPIRVDYDHINNIRHYYVDGAFHSFECAYRKLIEQQGKTIVSSDPLYSDSESLLLSWFESLYPNEKLKPANDFRLLKPRGPLTQEMFEQGMHNYKRTTNIFITPIKIQYLQIKTH